MSPIHPAITAHLCHFDGVWSHAFESLASALTGLDDADAFRQPSAYAGEPDDAGWPAPGSIAWQVAHLADCKHRYVDYLRNIGGAERPPIREWTPAATFPALRAQLVAEHNEQRAAIAALTPADLASTVGNGMGTAEFIAMATRHDAWHAAQIVVARRLLRRADAGA